MIVIGVDFHPEFQQIALVDTDTGEFRYGDLGYQSHYWGDLTHPTADGAKKVATKVVNFIKPAPIGSPFVQPWIQK